MLNLLRHLRLGKAAKSHFGDIRRGALGFTYDDFTSARDLAGAVVREVDPRSAAERAGLKPGDLVTELSGTPVRNAADLHIRLSLLRIAEGDIAGEDETQRVRIASRAAQYGGYRADTGP